MALIDSTGQKFGKLTALMLIRKPGDKRTYYECLCDCGRTKVVNSSKLRSGWTVSCGCAKGQCNIKHHYTRTRPYQIWNAMKQRCANPKTINYHRYGGAGITVCEEWKTFVNFWSDMKDGYADHLTLDRINNGKGYCKDNCRWLTPKEQGANQKTNFLITYRGETKILKRWAEEIGMNWFTLRNRILQGWDIEEAFNSPVKQYRK